MYLLVPREQDLLYESEIKYTANYITVLVASLSITCYDMEKNVLQKYITRFTQIFILLS